MLTWLSVLGAGLVAFLSCDLYRRFRANRIQALAQNRRASSRVASRGEFIDGNRTLDVALALTESAVVYENSEMEALLDLEWVREVEYDTRLATGRSVEDGKVLRLRSYSQMFEFVLPNSVVPHWQAMLPARRAVELLGVAEPAARLGTAT